MSFKLSVTKICRRLQEHRNYKRLHAEQKERNRKLEQELRELKMLYEKDVTDRDARIEKLLLRIGDLEKILASSRRERRINSAPPSSHSSVRTDPYTALHQVCAHV